VTNVISGTSAFVYRDISPHHFEADNRKDESGDKEDAPESGGFVKEYDADNNSTDGTYAGPDRIDCAYREFFSSFGHQEHAHRQGREKSNPPPDEFVPHSVFGLAEAEGKGHFHQARKYQNNPGHSNYRMPV
jgi:hypothetical protein